MIVKWTKKSNNTTFDITKVVGTISWSGSVTQAARQASITVLHAPNDSNIKKLKLNLSVKNIFSIFIKRNNIAYR